LTCVFEVTAASQTCQDRMLVSPVCESLEKNFLGRDLYNICCKIFCGLNARRSLALTTVADSFGGCREPGVGAFMVCLKKHMLSGLFRERCYVISIFPT
jgi:hypothetical protein